MAPAAVRIEPGDLICGDADGVVVVPKSEITGLLENAGKRVVHEAEVIQQLKKGKSTVEIYGFDSLN